ncbi:MAG: PASTA domain-containing protein [Bacteroidales bacterium]|nr:PASTA domain-containing protein [Bacteroidales bacterium]
MTAKDFFGNWIVKNLLLALALVLGLCVAATIFLNVFTSHGHELEVPDFTGMSVTRAKAEAVRHNLRVEVVDSIYMKRAPKGSIVRQDPKPGSRVKEGRRVQLVINAMLAKKVSMPNLVGYSLRSANAELVSRGLELGKLIYVNDMATNNVLSQLYRNREIAAGVQINSESRIDLVLGLNPADNYTSAPLLYGTKFKLALEKIHDNSLNVGTVRFDKTVKTYQDSLNAVVFAQTPGPYAGSNMGGSVSISLTLDENKVPVYKASEEEEEDE